jgi:hypothetical protein
LLRERQELATARLAQDGAGRILHGRDGVDELGSDAATREVGERGRHDVRPHAVAVERNADGVDAEARKPVQRALIAFLLDDDRIPAREKYAVDEIERLQRARCDQDLVGGAGNARRARELRGQELAQRPVAERAAGEPVGRERPALAREHGVGRRDQAIERDLIGVVVSPGEVVFRGTRPLRRRRRQPGGQHGRKVERSGGHGYRFSLSVGPLTGTLQSRMLGGMAVR